MTKDKDTERDAGKRCRTEDEQKIDNLIFAELVHMLEVLIDEAHLENLCVWRLVERLAVNLNLFMATVIEGLQAKPSKGKRRKGK